MRDRNDPMGQVRRLTPVDRDKLAASWSNSEAKQVVFEEITAMPIDTDTNSPTPRTGVPRRTVVVAATVATMGLATVGWAVIGPGDVAETTRVGCHTPDDAVAVVGATSGDPVADCASLWTNQHGQAPPDMVAYDNGSGGIEVVPAAETVPDHWEALEPGVTQDPRLIELEAALDDAASGLRSACLVTDDARQIVRNELDRLGFRDWSIAIERGEADGTDTCSYAAVRPDSQQVALYPLEGLVAPDDDPIQQFARTLGATLDHQCLTTPQAAAEAANLATSAGVDGISIQELADPGAECARVDINVGGSVDVTIRGPQGK